MEQEVVISELCKTTEQTKQVLQQMKIKYDDIGMDFSFVAVSPPAKVTSFLDCFNNHATNFKLQLCSTMLDPICTSVSAQEISHIVLHCNPIDEFEEIARIRTQRGSLFQLLDAMEG